jgi:hypothetical protein
VAAHVHVVDELAGGVLQVDLVEVARGTLLRGLDGLLLADLGLALQVLAVVQARLRRARMDAFLMVGGEGGKL